MISRCAGLTYEEALRLAAQNKVDDEVITAFDQEHKRVSVLGDLQRLAQVKVNFCAALIDAANRSRDHRMYTKMYRKCMKLSKEALKINVRSLKNDDCFIDIDMIDSPKTKMHSKTWKPPK